MADLTPQTLPKLTPQQAYRPTAGQPQTRTCRFLGVIYFTSQNPWLSTLHRLVEIHSSQSICSVVNLPANSPAPAGLTARVPSVLRPSSYLTPRKRPRRGFVAQRWPDCPHCDGARVSETAGCKPMPPTVADIAATTSSLPPRACCTAPISHCPSGPSRYSSTPPISRA